MNTILFCGGGSAGHVIPNIAIIEDLGSKYKAVYMGTDGIEKTVCKNNGVEFKEFDAVKLVRGKILCNLKIPFKLIKSISDAGKIIDEVKPDLVFCKGGFVSIPPAFAAKKRGIPVITHESDISVGLANKIIAGKCEKVLTTFPAAAQKFKNGVCTGSPMRKILFSGKKTAALNRFGFDMRPVILVLGGGSGSEIINEHIRQIAPKICRDYNILHICGKGKKADINLYGYRQIEFTNEMPLVYAAADYAVSRCGSNAASELIAMKIPSLFIPLENKRSRGDQVKNAQFFKALGLCRILREGELSEGALCREIYGLIHDDKLKNTLNKSSVKCGNENIIREINAAVGAHHNGRLK